ncbi:hypothetical protein BGZ60DRAFT_422234 [Tricladium varicosporioides]|nr:hypothetical protein BGZ60DRAFT_422234 [Hymenoscyphus varicosporioides]
METAPKTSIPAMSKPAAGSNMPRPDQLSTPPESFSMSLLNVAVQGLMIIIIHARIRAKEYKISALEWDDYALMFALVGVWYTRRPVVYMVL